MRLSIVDIGLAVPAIDMTHDGRMRVVNRNIRDLNIRRRLELLKCLEKIALCRIGNQLSCQSALACHAENNRASILV